MYLRYVPNSRLMLVHSLVVLISSYKILIMTVQQHDAVSNLQMADHLVSVSDIVCLEPHPGQPASLHEVDQHVSYRLQVIPSALLYSLMSVY